MNFKTALSAIFGVIVLHTIALSINIYATFPNFDIFMHFAGGVVIGLLGIAIHHAMTDKHHKRIHMLYHVLFILGFVMLVGVAWEFHEYILDNTLVIWYGWQKTQPSIADTMMDLLMDGVGALASVAAFRKKL